MGEAPPKALVLAAGKSTRIATVAKGLPKPLIEIKGEPVLVHNLKLLSRHGIKDVWINLHFEAEKIRQAAGDGSKWKLAVRYSVEKEILGTAGAIKNLEKEFLGSPFYILYGDNFTDCDLKEMMNRHSNSKADATIAVFNPAKNPNSGIAGGRIETDSAGWVNGFREGAQANEGQNSWVNAGVYILNPSVLGQIPTGFSDFGKDIFPAMLSKGQKVFSYPIKGFCFAVDTPESYEQTQKLVS